MHLNALPFYISVQGAASQQYDFKANTISLRANSSLHFKGGSPGIDLVSEGAGDPLQYDSKSGNIKRSDNGNCLDITYW